MTRSLPAALVLFDRDGTLIENVPHNADPDLVVPMPGARAALDLLRAAGVATAVVSNQSVIGRGWAAASEVAATNDRVEDLLGPLGPFFVCPHTPQDGCRCRKPQPGLILDALTHFGVESARATMIGDMGSDIDAAHAAGVQAILVPTTGTPEADVAAARRSAWCAPSLTAAVERVLREV